MKIGIWKIYSENRKKIFDNVIVFILFIFCLNFFDFCVFGIWGWFNKFVGKFLEYELYLLFIFIY